MSINFNDVFRALIPLLVFLILNKYAPGVFRSLVKVFKQMSKINLKRLFKKKNSLNLNSENEFERIEYLAVNEPFLLVDDLFSSLKKHETKYDITNRLNALSALCLVKGETQIKAFLKILPFFTLTSRELAELAMKMAQGQNFHQIGKAVVDSYDSDLDDFFSLLSHELVLRKINLKENPAYFELAFNINHRSKEFSKLPLNIFATESDYLLPTFNIRGCGWSNAYEDVRYVDFEIFQSEQITIKCQKNEDVLLAVKGWAEKSNGRLQGYNGTYEISEVYDPRQVLNSIYNEITGNKAPLKLKYKQATLGKVLSNLFSAAANGGAYGGSEYGARGRLLAFKSLAGLLNLNWDLTTPEEILDKAKSYDFYEFIIEGEWFIDFLQDFGILAINNHTKHFGLLAATDTD